MQHMQHMRHATHTYVALVTSVHGVEIYEHSSPTAGYALHTDKELNWTGLETGRDAVATWSGPLMSF